jgi:uncharacterized protein YecE (DUF72 family)
MSILAGNASWTDATPVKSKRFYPAGCDSAETRLRFYVSQFPVVEVDSSYYAMPSGAKSVRWVERTPPHFVFNIKAFRIFTGHQTPRDMFPKDVRARSSACMGDAGLNVAAAGTARRFTHCPLEPALVRSGSSTGLHGIFNASGKCPRSSRCRHPVPCE